MHAYLAVTDNDWFRFLRSKPNLEEVNFWQPSGQRQFRTLAPGEPFLFKLHAPDNYVVGGGFFSASSLLPATLAWEIFGEQNGARTYREMRARIEKYRRTPLDQHEEPTIGCILLFQPFFLHERDWIPVPQDWSANIVQGKTYDTTAGIGADLWDQVRMRLLASRPAVEMEDLLGQPSMFGDPVLMQPRLGQGSFRVLVTDIYQRHCAVTGEKALPVLDAAHVRGVADGGTHRIDNGLLLRTDVHRLFDKGYVTVTPDYRVRVSRRLKTDFDNGEPYYPFHEQEIWLPSEPRNRPNREFLEWHAETVFRA